MIKNENVSLLTSKSNSDFLIDIFLSVVGCFNMKQILILQSAGFPRCQLDVTCDA